MDIHGFYSSIGVTYISNNFENIMKTWGRDDWGEAASSGSISSHTDGRIFLALHYYPYLA
jgi:hypothetical protein